MKRLTLVMFVTVIFFLWNIPTVVAQFKEAGVQKFEAPVDATDFTLKELGGKENLVKRIERESGCHKLFYSRLTGVPEGVSFFC